MLQKGDIIYIQKGLPVMCEEIPEIYYKGHHPYSKKLTQGMITIGVSMISRTDIRQLREEISDLIRFAFAFKKVPLDLSILERFINHQVPSVSPPGFLAPEGEYIVTQVKQSSTVAYAHLQTYDPELPLRKIEIAADYERSADKRLIKVVGQDLGYVER